MNTPRPVWNPDAPQPIKFFDTWSEVPGLGTYENGFKIEWEMFIRHLYEDAPFKWTPLEGAKGVQLAQAGLKSWKERRWVDIPALGARWRAGWPLRHNRNGGRCPSTHREREESA